MTTANKYKGEIKERLGDKERVFRLTFDSIVNIESRTGKSIMDITNEIALNKYSMKDIVVILHEGLISSGLKLTQPSVGDMIMKTGLVKSSLIAANLLTTIFTGEDKEDDDSPLEQGENEQKDTQSKNT
tara:strand:+ start:235 stop:621 length:387 start_codon:yes stop_codon:yes gene_type:complete